MSPATAKCAQRSWAQRGRFRPRWWCNRWLSPNGWSKSRLSRRSNLALATRVDWPDFDQRVAVDHVIEIVQVDRRIAMRRNALYYRAERRPRRGRRHEQLPVLVAEELVAAAGRRTACRFGPRAFGGEALEAGVGHEIRRLVDADHRRRDKQRRFKGRRVAAVGERMQIFDIHEDIGADLELGEDPRFGIEIEGARAAAGDDRRRQIVRRQFPQKAAYAIRQPQAALAPLSADRNVLQVAGIGLDAGKAKTRRGMHRTGQRRRCLDSTTGAALPGIDVDQH